MSTRMTIDGALYPPSVTPPEEPLKPLAFLRAFARNPLLTLPRGAYRELVLVHRPTPRVKIAWISDPELIEEMLVDKRGRFQKNLVERRVLGPILGEGLLIAEGAAWRWQRRAVAPLLRAGDVARYVPQMAVATREQIRRWQDVAGADGNAGRQAIDKAMVDLTFSIIARTMLAGGEPAEAELIKREGNVFLEHTSWEIGFTLLRLPRWVPHPHKFRSWLAARRVRKAVTAIVKRRQAAIGKGHEAGDDLLAKLLDARDPETGQTMDTAQVVDNLSTLLAAGHETTAKALTWTLYLLARAPEWQARAREEVLAVAGRGAINATHIGRLELLERILKEAMRLYPPVIVIARTPSAPTELFGETFQPRDQLAIPIWCLHRHEKLWDDPDRFDPDRFLPENEQRRPRGQYIPFGAGARICIGMSFAMTEAKVALATLLQYAAFEWDGKYEPEPVSRVTLRPRHGMPLNVRLF